MASNFGSSVYRTSDLIHDFVCSQCKRNGFNNEVYIFCDECKIYFCNDCEKLHNELFRTHTVIERQDVSKWVWYEGMGPIEACDKHGHSKLELLCEDHDELCCHICVCLSHGMCQSTKLIRDLDDELKKQTDFTVMKFDVQKIDDSLQAIEKKMKHNKQSLKDSGKKLLAEIKTLRKKVNDKFDELEQKTDEQIHETNVFVQEDIGKCATLTEKVKTYLHIIQPQTEEDNSYIAYKKCKDNMREAESLIQHLSVKHDKSLKFDAPAGIEKILSGFNALLYDESYVYNLKNNSQYTVKIQNDTVECSISGICDLPGGEILILDSNNHKVKLLTSEFQVTATCDLPEAPRHICHITGNEAAVYLVRKGVHFITVTGSALSVTRKFRFPYSCLGISHHNGNLYIGSSTAIYQYTLSGQLVKKIYEDNSTSSTENSFAVSRDGTRIYIPFPKANELITIDTSGNILSTLKHIDLFYVDLVCVSDNGHVFVCSKWDGNVIQVDKEGKQILAKPVKWTDVPKRPEQISKRPVQIWFTRQTNKLIVGLNGNEIFVFDLE